MLNNQKYHNLPEPPEPPEKPQKSQKSDATGKPQNKKKKKLTVAQKVKYVLSVIGTTFLTLFLIIVITTCIVAVALSVYVSQFADSMYDVDLKEDYTLSLSSFVYAYDKEIEDYVEILQLSADENRIWVDYEEIPQHTVDALVATEDKRFYEHAGVDWTRTVFAAFNEFTSGEEGRQQGGSTITQQLVRDITKDNQVNIGRKLREIFRAMSLEQTYSKHDIVESYLNRVAFGNTIYGIGAAARHYFDKDVSELTIAESCVLVALLPSPVSGNPYNNPEWNRRYQKQAIFNLYDQGFISYAQYEAAGDEQVRFRLPISPQCRCPEDKPRCDGDYFGYIDERYEEYYGLQNQEESSEDEDLYFQDADLADLVDDPFRWDEYEVTHNWYVDAALKQIAQDIADLKGITLENAREQVRKGGLHIYLSMDVEMQEKIEEVFKDEYLVRTAIYPSGTPARDTIQAAFVIMDLYGNVVALAGGLGDKPGNDVFNRAVMAQRNIGSTIKPFGVYAPAIDMDKITYSTMILDSPGRIYDAGSPGGFKLWPANYGAAAFVSNYSQTAWEAVMKSTNTVSARTLHMVGVHTAFNFLQDRLGITTLLPQHADYSPLATGSVEMKLHEVVGAYQIFGTGGVYYKPAFYSKIVDNDGNIVLEKDYSGIQAIGADSAWIVNRMMEKAVSGSTISPKTGMPNIEVVGKTGTANDMSDVLFCGLTPDYVAAVRIGFDDNRAMRSNYEDYWKSPTLTWGSVMSRVIPTDVARSFTPESSVVTAYYCPAYGLIKGPDCPAGYVGYYKPTNVPITCTHDEYAASITSQEVSPLFSAS